MKKMLIVGMLLSTLSGVYGMNVQGNDGDEFGRRMTEILASINEQHKREVAILDEQNVANRKILMNKITERDVCIARLQEEMQKMQEQFKQERQGLEKQIEVLSEIKDRPTCPRPPRPTPQESNARRKRIISEIGRLQKEKDDWMKYLLPKATATTLDTVVSHDQEGENEKSEKTLQFMKEYHRKRFQASAKIAQIDFQLGYLRSELLNLEY